MSDVFDIDKNNLDTEWENQSSLFYKHAMQLADARQELEQARAELDLTRAELDLAIRSSPEQFFDGVKATEASIQGMVLQQEDYEAAMKAHIKAKHAVDVCFAMVNALDHRKSALERLVSLHGQNYYATPKARGGDAQQAVKASARKKSRRPVKK